MRAAFNPLVLDGAFNGGLADAVRDVGMAWQQSRREAAGQDRADRIAAGNEAKASKQQARQQAFTLAQMGIEDPQYPEFVGVANHVKAKEALAGRSVHQIRNADGSEVPVIIDKTTGKITPAAGGNGQPAAAVQAEGKPVANHVLDELNRQVSLMAMQAGEMERSENGYTVTKPAEYELRRKSAFLRAGVHPDNLQPLGPNNPYGVAAPAGHTPEAFSLPASMQGQPPQGLPDAEAALSDVAGTGMWNLGSAAPVPVRPDTIAPMPQSQARPGNQQVARIAAFGRPEARPAQRQAMGLDEAKAAAMTMAQDPRGAEALVAAAIAEYGMTRAQAEQFIAQALR
jgi:hypothetical protein